MSLIMQKLRSPPLLSMLLPKLHHGQKLSWPNFEWGEGAGELLVISSRFVNNNSFLCEKLS